MTDHTALDRWFLDDFGPAEGPSVYEYCVSLDKCVRKLLPAYAAQPDNLFHDAMHNLDTCYFFEDKSYPFCRLAWVELAKTWERIKTVYIHQEKEAA